MTLDRTDDLCEQRQPVHAYSTACLAISSPLYRLLEAMLSPLDRKLALAPIDDEPVTPEDRAAIQAGVASLERGGGAPIEEVLADFGLTMDDFRKMARTPGRKTRLRNG